MAKRLSGTEAQFEVIRRYSIAFLEKHVAQRKDAAKVLDRSDWMLTRYDREPNRDLPGRNRGISIPN